MSFLSIKSLSFKVGKFALNNISFDIGKGEYFVILGRSGAGKTLILESIAGIQKASGDIIYNDKSIIDLPPEQREVGFVYQDFALFPNLNVKQNILFSSRYKKIENVKELFDDVVDFLGLEALLDRKIDHLSGGEKQRIAIGRALCSRPEILLLDEPLSAIDPTFRNNIMKFLKTVHRRYNLTTLHVTHNFREASYLADRIAIVMNGNLLQVGQKDEVLSRPATLEVAEFLGFKNIFKADILGKNGSFSIDPNAIYISKDIRPSCDYTFEGILEECMGITDHFKLYIRVGDDQFFVKALKREHESCSIEHGSKVYLGFNEKDICYL